MVLANKSRGAGEHQLAHQMAVAQRRGASSKCAFIVRADHAGGNSQLRQLQWMSRLTPQTSKLMETDVYEKQKTFDQGAQFRSQAHSISTEGQGNGRTRPEDTSARQTGRGQ